MLLINRLKITIIFIFYFPYTVPPIHTPILGRSKGRVSHHWSENLEIELFFIQKEETKSKRKTAKTFLPSSLNPAVSRWKTQKWAIFLIRVKESKRRGKTTKNFYLHRWILKPLVDNTTQNNLIRIKKSKGDERLQKDFTLVVEFLSWQHK